MARGWTKFDKAKVLQAIKDSAGVKLLICKRLNCDRGTFDRYLAKFPEVKAAFDAEIEEIGDVVESKIIEGIREGNVALAIFYAKTKLKHRGYVERQEVENTQPVVIHIDEDDVKL